MSCIVHQHGYDPARYDYARYGHLAASTWHSATWYALSYRTPNEPTALSLSLSLSLSPADLADIKIYFRQAINRLFHHNQESPLIFGYRVPVGAIRPGMLSDASANWEPTESAIVYLVGERELDDSCKEMQPQELKKFAEPQGTSRKCSPKDPKRISSREIGWNWKKLKEIERNWKRTSEDLL